jgi:hypothetical protein
MIKATRVEHTIPGWVSFKLSSDGKPSRLTKEQLIESLKKRLKEKVNNE